MPNRIPEGALRALLERIPVAVFALTADVPARVVYVSPQIEELLGYPLHDWEARGADVWFDAVHPEDRDRVVLDWIEAVNSDSSFTSEYRIAHRDGHEVRLRTTSRPWTEADGRRLWVGISEDVSIVRSAEQELDRSEARYRALVEDIPAVIYEMGQDDERRTLYVNPQVEKILGYSRAEWLDQPDIWIELLHPDDREIELAAHDLHNETGQPWSREYRLIAADGRNVWVRDQAVLVRDDGGRPRTWQGVMLDITAQKEAEEHLRSMNDDLELRVLARTAELADANEMMALEIGERRRAETDLRKAEERYRQLVEHLPAAVYIWDLSPGANGEPSQNYTGPQIEALLGYGVAEWIEPNFWITRVHPHDLDAVLQAVRACELGGDPFNLEYRFLAKDGRVVWVLDQAILLNRDGEGRPKLYQGVILDTTARKTAEAKAADAEARYRVLAEEGPVIAYTWERRAKPGEPVPFGYVSPRIADVLGYPVDAWTGPAGGLLWWRCVHPDDRAFVQGLSEQVERTGEPWRLDYRVIAADGRIVWLHDEGRLLARDETGAPHQFHGVLLDVTAQHEAEERLRDAEARYRGIVEGMPAIPWTTIVDRATGIERFVYIGPQALDILGYPAEELLAEPGHLERIVHPEDRDRLLAAENLAASGIWEERFRVVARDGSTRWLHAIARRVTPDDGDPIVWQGVTFDVTSTRGGSDPGVVAVEEPTSPGRSLV